MVNENSDQSASNVETDVILGRAHMSEGMFAHVAALILKCSCMKLHYKAIHFSVHYSSFLLSFYYENTPIQIY